MLVARRLLLYLVAGVVLVGAGLLVLVWGELIGDTTFRLAGLALCVASLPLLLQAKLTRLEDRVARLERRQARHTHPSPDSPRYADDEEDEEEEPAT